MAVAALVLLVYALLQTVIGVTYMPGKRGGMLLSGIPTLLIVFSSLSLSLAFLLTIVDHYDTRPNEHWYKTAKNRCYMATLYLLIAAPLLELADILLRLFGWDMLPHFHGLASHYTLYTPELQNYLPLLHSWQQYDIAVLLISFGLLLISWLLMKWFPRYGLMGALLCCVGLGGLFFEFFLLTVEDFLSGKVTYNDATLEALKEPAKFNAILLTHAVMSVVMLSASLAGVFLAIRKRSRFTSL